MRKLVHVILAILITFIFTGCTNYHITQVTEHKDKLYLTTGKTTTFLFFWSSQQMILECNAISGKETRLDCKEAPIKVENNSWFDTISDEEYEE